MFGNGDFNLSFCIEIDVYTYCKYLSNVYMHIYIYTCLIDIEKTEDMCTVRHNMSVDTFYQIVTFAGNIRSSLRMRLPTKKRSGVLYITGPCVGIMYSICIYGVVYFHIYIYLHTL